MVTVVAKPATGVVGSMNKLSDVCLVVREIHFDMTVNQLLVFLLIAANPGVSRVRLIEITGLADSTITRIISILSKWGARSTSPLNLIEIVHDAVDRRTKTYVLTPTGQMLAEKLSSIVHKGVR